MYKSQFEGAEADRRLALIDSINEQLCPKRSGTLPLTIDSIGGNLSDWTIFGNNEGVGEETENFFNKNANDTNNGYVSGKYLAVDNRELANEYYVISEYIQIQPSTTYYLSNVIGSGASTALCFYNTNKEYISGVKLYVSGTRTTEVISPDDAVFLRTSVQVYKGYIDTAMITESEVSEYIPYGYKIPIKVTSGTSTKQKDIYIGDSPLTEGQSVSKSSTGIEIKVERGQSVIETTLTNKPEMDAKIDRIKMIEQALISMQSSGGYNETQSDTISDEVTEVTK